jgi:hypothetical protein
VPLLLRPTRRNLTTFFLILFFNFSSSSYILHHLLFCLVSKIKGQSSSSTSSSLSLIFLNRKRKKKKKRSRDGMQTAPMCFSLFTGRLSGCRYTCAWPYWLEGETSENAHSLFFEFFPYQTCCCLFSLAFFLLLPENILDFDFKK